MILDKMVGTKVHLDTPSARGTGILETRGNGVYKVVGVHKDFAILFLKEDVQSISHDRIHLKGSG